MISVDWAGIRPSDGSRSAGFEELCTQLARAESPINARFVRKGAPDAGVECFCVLADGSEWGWQAKYFSELRNASWSQIDESVRKALDKHPNLVRYFVCIPVDRADARLEGRISALERWDQRVAKWKDWSQERGMDVEFVWWGSSELQERLSQQQYAGCLYYWFGRKGFDRSWFGSRLDEALRTAGPRYTPELHVELDIGQRLEQFGRTEAAIDRLKSLAIGIRRRLQSLRHLSSSDRELLSEFDLDGVIETIDEAVGWFAALEAAPGGELPLSEIVDRLAVAEVIADEIASGLHEMGREYEAQRRRDGWNPRYGESPHAQLAGSFSGLRREISGARHRLIEAAEFVNRRLLVIDGAAGTGKTHLLCDFARSLVDKGVPCVLLMGQRFTEPAEPWGQVLRQVGMHGDHAEHFVGALEAAAQSANARALVIIDAVNEGRGREVWRNHLEAFLAPLEKSEWIGVVLSVRTGYRKVIFPEEVMERATSVTHHGFEGHEYDAIRTFFAYYDLEFPSAPALHPEYRNPLYLKIVCEGLSRSGQTRLPRGAHGITSSFNLYLDAVNKQLAETLDYNSQDNLVRKALNSIARQCLVIEQRWLPREQAERLVNELLPVRNYSRSLYFGLITSGALVEDLGQVRDGLDEENVFIAYERFADHIVADFLLHDLAVDHSLEGGFVEGGRLAFLKEDGCGAFRGLIAALCIQVPERTGQELLGALPELVDYPDIGELFLESVVWRRLDAFSDRTTEALNLLTKWGAIWEEPVDTWLSVSTIPGHPFNAEFLDHRLRKDSMADRDAWWSIYLHRTWGDNGPVDRLVDWAFNVSPEDDLEIEVIDLCAISLAWMFTTSNRFLRDRATKALVSLLTGRVASADRLVRRFADVDDPYVRERVCAAAYGVAMRSQDAKEVGKLATTVYDEIFASGSPPPHNLLRDHARGVIEKALNLGADIAVDERLIQPPYQSVWPVIPDDDAIEALAVRHDRPVFAGLSRVRPLLGLQGSVMDGDFAIYIIGIRGESDWLSVPFGQSRWRSPGDRLDALWPQLNDSERAAWDEYQNGQEHEPAACSATIATGGASVGPPTQCGDDGCPLAEGRGSGGDSPEEQTDGTEWNRLAIALTPEHYAELEAIYLDREAGGGAPRFDLRLVQRYILWRVFDLGWTVERFGHFDWHVNRDDFRQAGKAERIGKKYQWIAYHEILAHIADHYQYWRSAWLSVDYGDHEYEGPWQDFDRDVDPSWVLVPGNQSRRHWWEKPSYETWIEHLSHRNWLAISADLPSVSELVAATCLDDGSRWLNLDGSFLWEQPHPADINRFDVERREVWLRCTGYFIRAEDADQFGDWVRGSHYTALERYQAPELSRIYIGEHGWAPSFKYLEDDLDSVAEAVLASHWPGFIQPSAVRYSCKPNGFDCSGGDIEYVNLPYHKIIDRLGLRWSGVGSDFSEPSGELAAFDPLGQGSDCDALLIREDLLRRYLIEEQLALCWVIQGGKRIIGGEARGVYKGRAVITGIYRFTDKGIEGSLEYTPHLPTEAAGGTS